MKDHLESQSSVADRVGVSWGHALRDVLLIVVSIMIAFSLDAWWDGQARVAREHEALTALHAELQASRIELDSVVLHNELLVARARLLLDLDRGSIEFLDRDSLVFSYGGLNGGMTFDPSVGAIDAILAGGLDLVTNVQLRAAMAAWPGMLREIEVDQWAIVERWEKLSDALVEAELRIEYLDIRQESAAVDTELLRQFVAKTAEVPAVRQRVAALAASVMGLLEELSDVEVRLRLLEEMVADELAL
ncbi:MAG: hypothetical protein E4H28_01175 [Gemmatimonadales bacterium]|nr:MAG: hypothetical protein E4H28_01175 [Gemmatimonadales bacterium]